MPKTQPHDGDRLVVGWHEWVALPDLGVDAIIAKIDTGARTSALHAAEIDRDYVGGAPVARLRVHVAKRDPHAYITAEAEVIDSRLVKSSTGDGQRRLIVGAQLTVAGKTWPIELSVTNRKSMRFRMLLGRSAMAGRMLVDPGANFLLGGSSKLPADPLLPNRRS